MIKSPVGNNTLEQPTNMDQSSNLVERTSKILHSQSDMGDSSSSRNLWPLLANISLLNSQIRGQDHRRQRLLEIVTGFFGAERSLLIGLDRSGGREIMAQIGYVENAKLKSLHLPDSIASRVCKSRASLIVADCHGGSGDSGFSAPSILAAPIKSGNELASLVYLERDCSSGGFSRKDKELLDLVGEWVALTVFQNGQSNGQTLALTLEKLTETFPIGLIVTDSDANIQIVNGMAAEILDLNYNEISQNLESKECFSFWEMLPDSQIGRWRYMITTALTSHERLHEPNLEIDTGYMIKSVAVDIAPWETVVSGGTIITLADNTERSILNEYLVLTEKLAARGELADEIGKKLDSQISSLALAVASADQSLDKEQWDKVRFGLKGISGEILKLQLLASSLSDLSRPATEYISYDIKALIEDILFSLRHQPRFRQIHFTIDMDHDVPNIEIDVYHIQQLLRDLLDNAADATELGAISAQEKQIAFSRKISLQVCHIESSEMVSLSVSDNGPGLSKDEIKRIFELHYTTKTHAHGIGLYNCRRTVEQHHGEIIVSENTGGGTTMNVLLPRYQPRAENRHKEDNSR